MAMTEPDPPNRLERFAQGLIRWIGRMISRTVQRILGLILILGVVVLGGANTPANVSPAVRWTLVAVMIVATVAAALLVWRSRTRKKLVDFQREIDALEAQVRKGEELHAVQAEELSSQSGEIAAAERAKIYGKMLDDVTNGIYSQLCDGVASGDELVRFIEDNSLKLINDTFSAELATDGDRPRIETGIALRTATGFQVTHASGPFTKDLKHENGCYAPQRSIQEVLSLKAAASFVRDGWFVLPLTDTQPLQYFFMLSTVLPEEPETDALKRHAALIKMTVAALTPVTAEG